MSLPTSHLLQPRRGVTASPSARPRRVTQVSRFRVPPTRPRVPGLCGGAGAAGAGQGAGAANQPRTLAASETGAAANGVGRGGAERWGNNGRAKKTGDGGNAPGRCLPAHGVLFWGDPTSSARRARGCRSRTTRSVRTQVAGNRLRHHRPAVPECDAGGRVTRLALLEQDQRGPAAVAGAPRAFRVLLANRTTRSLFQRRLHVAKQLFWVSVPGTKGSLCGRCGVGRSPSPAAVPELRDHRPQSLRPCPRTRWFIPSFSPGAPCPSPPKGSPRRLLRRGSHFGGKC